ncbi:g13352 [Coccomyxa viridis]|uniref:G13352 protein n=1 Tax=Coccomyxa viridis TaxID=1274662 RepID=A0ABP1GDI4_9CHLO
MRHGGLAGGLGTASIDKFISRVTCPRLSRGRTAALPVQQQARINLGINYHCEFGQQVVVVGSSERLGNWQADCGLAMQWNEGDDWTVDLDLPIEDCTAVEYKYVIRGPHGDVTWKPGSNYDIPLPEQGPAAWLQTAIAIKDAWDESFRCIQMDTQESESIAMEKALSKLDALVTDAMANEQDPSAPEQLAADAEVAVAARQALQLLRAIQASESTRMLQSGKED